MLFTFVNQENAKISAVRYTNLNGIVFRIYLFKKRGGGQFSAKEG